MLESYCAKQPILFQEPIAERTNGGMYFLLGSGLQSALFYCKLGVEKYIFTKCAFLLSLLV